MTVRPDTRGRQLRIVVPIDSGWFAIESLFIIRRFAFDMFFPTEYVLLVGQFYLPLDVCIFD